MQPKRLIQDDDIILDGTGPRYQKEAEAFHKLSEYEGIDEELGLPWPIIYKALKDGIYDKDDYYCPHLEHTEHGFVLIEEQGDYGPDIWFYPKDYKKLWALTREELK